MTATAAFSPDDRVELNPVFLLRWEEAQQSHVLLYPEGLVKLNETAALILDHCREGCRVGTLIERLTLAYGGADIGPDIMDFLSVAHAKSWIKIHA